LNDDRLLHDALQNATDTRQVVMGASVLSSTVEVFKQVFGERSAVVIAGANTFDVAGCDVQRQLAAAHFPPLNP
jgi:glycerol-1-phosphate dehydrogenase [NAD(P)+]